MQTSAHSVWPQAQAGEGQEKNVTLQRRRSHLQIKIVITCIYRPEKKEHKLTKLQNKQTISKKPKFHCHGKLKKTQENCLQKS